MKINPKGQVTIPVEFREELGFFPATEVVFERDGDALRLRKAEEGPTRRGERLVSLLRGSAAAGLTTDEILGLTRGERQDPKKLGLREQAPLGGSRG